MSGNFKPLFGTPLNRDHPLARGLVGCWLFNEGTGKYVWDATGNGNDGVLTNMADPPTATSGWGPGPHGGALLLDGSNDYVTAGKAVIPLTGDRTVITRFTYNSAAKIEGILSQYIAGMTGRFALNINQGESGQLAANTLNVFGAPNLVMSKAGLSAGVEYEAALTLAGSVATLYLNGVAVDTGVSTDFADVPFMVGRLGDLTTYGFTGLVSSVPIYNRALSAEEVAYLYHNPYCMFEEEAFPAWMIPPLAVPQTVYGAARGVPILHGRGMRRHSESSRRPGQLSTTRRAG